MDLYIEEKFIGPQLNPDLFRAEDYPGVTLVDTPARHPGHGSALVELPWNWHQGETLKDPACEIRIRGRNTYGQRASGGNRLEYGTNVMLGVSYMFPEGNTIGYPTTILQFATGKVQPDRSGPPSLALRLMPNNEFVLRLRTAKSSDPTDERIFAIDHRAGVAIPGQWYDFVFHLNFALADGLVDAWCNGEQFAQFGGRTIGAVAIEEFVFAKIGIYAPSLRENIVQPGIVQRVHIGALRYGPEKVGYGAVDPATWIREIDREALRAWLDEGAQWVARGRGLVG